MAGDAYADSSCAGVERSKDIEKDILIYPSLPRTSPTHTKNFCRPPFFLSSFTSPSPVMDTAPAHAPPLVAPPARNGAKTTPISGWLFPNESSNMPETAGAKCCAECYYAPADMSRLLFRAPTRASLVAYVTLNKVSSSCSALSVNPKAPSSAVTAGPSSVSSSCLVVSPICREQAQAQACCFWRMLHGGACALPYRHQHSHSGSSLAPALHAAMQHGPSARTCMQP